MRHEIQVFSFFFFNDNLFVKSDTEPSKRYKFVFLNCNCINSTYLIILGFYLMYSFIFLIRLVFILRLNVLKCQLPLRATIN